MESRNISGPKQKKEYFEGWYFKSVSKDEQTAYAIIVGVSITKIFEDSHAFIMLMDARNQVLHYFSYPMSSFWANNDKFEIKIAKNYFSLDHMVLDIEDGETRVKADMEFKNIVPWPVTRFSPGAMGFFAFIPFLECYHGVLSFNHSINGYVAINNDKIDFTSGKGYVEKDWGSSMPSSWIWMQTNHFDEEGISLFVSIAKIPWLGSYFTGYIFGLVYGGKIYKFTTYNRAKIEKLQVTDKDIEIKISNKKFILQINALRAEGVDLPAPKLGEMTSKVNESLRSKINIKLYRKEKNTNKLLYQGTGRNAGLEFVGNLEELLNGF
ncbi:MAG: hypothetical protein NKF70_00940 [Methanobacterium sp. ERen5]|nr:MAG: hypothetical protein NKF70_00940 [Methanobacterium sp. ERen5]